MIEEMFVIKMWKIKDNVDLKELEKFGYFYGSNDISVKCWIKELEYNDEINIYENKEIYFYLSDVSCTSKEQYENMINNFIQDLIKADLVEKVDE